MSDWSTLALDLAKTVLKQARYSGAILALGLTLIFAPAKYLDFFALTEFRNEGRVWIGPVTFLAAAIWGVQLFSFVVSGWHRWQTRRSRRREMIELLHGLTVEERFRMVSCVVSGTSTFFAALTDPTAHALHSKSLALRLAGGGSMLEWPSVITPEVWRYINDHPDIILRGVTFEELQHAAGGHRLPHLRA